uniref:ABC transporter B family member 6-like n=1 Tax=Dermatophagoides pteronyssinus TaxID=6956 RepID=A0A6P6XJA4_DERPT|nr:ABC transporter B family member 6-like [Dermatophagoides pteronyssinus]
MTAADLVRLLDATQTSNERLKTAMVDYVRADTKVVSSLHILNFFQKLFLETGSLKAVSQTILSAEPGNSTSLIKQVSATTSAFQNISSTLHFLGTLTQTWILNWRRMKKVSEILMNEQNIQDEAKKELVINRGSIRFNNLFFKYPGSTDYVIKNFNLFIPGKAKIGITGTNGAGKTSLLKLLMRLYNAEKGEILVCGQNISDVSINSLRSKIAVIPQQAYLFNGSLRENLLFGNNEAAITDNDIDKVVNSLELQSLVKKIGGYNAIIEENGSNLSGGEKQLLSIIRCALKNPSIVLIDEVTTFLDKINENKVLEVVKKFCEDKTMIVVTHEPYLLKDLDEVIILDKGLIVERGSFDELEKNGLIFKNLFDYVENTKPKPLQNKDIAMHCSSGDSCCSA